jgi:hypothetical protein
MGKRGPQAKIKPGEPGWSPDDAVKAAMIAAGWKPPESAGIVGVQDIVKRYERMLALYESKVDTGDREVPNMKAALEMIERYAETNGISRRALIDRRTEADKFQDAVTTLIAAPMEVADAELQAVFEGMRAATRGAVSEVEDRVRALRVPGLQKMADEEDAAKRKERERRARLGKTWLRRLVRLARVRKWARQDCPKTAVGAVRLGEMNLCESSPYLSSADMEHCVRMARVLRHSMYVMRSNLSVRQKEGGSASVLEVRNHHCQMAMAWYFMDRPYTLGEAGVVRNAENKETGVRGAIIVIGPGMGKTQAGVGYVTMRLAENRYLKVLLTHARDDDAKKNLRYTADFLKDDNPGGRRFAALYGPVDHDIDNGAQFRIKLPEKSRQPTLQAGGVRGKIAGADADLVWGDDFVDRSERDQPEERARTLTAWESQWVRRLRDETGKHFTTATLWHEDDANAKRVKMARDGLITLVTLLLRCGGPDDRPAFYSLWPERYPSKLLKEIYASDPAMYSAMYMCDPRSESTQIIKKLRFYDPNTAEHREFLNSAVHHLSIDPSASTRQGSDKTGMAHGACGDVIGKNDKGEEMRESRLRLLEFRQMNATVSDVVENIATFSMSRKVDYVHVEVVQAFSAIPEMCRNQWGIDCIPHVPGTRSKELRLRGVAVLLDDSHKSDVFGGAVVEFPGVVGGDGVIGPDPTYSWVYEQFYRFGVIKNDHVLDATTQLCAHLQRGGELNSGAGWVSQKARDAVAENGDPRLRRMLDGYQRPEPKTTVEREDTEFLNQMGDDAWN